MKNNILLLHLLTITVMFGCSSPLDKPILTPLEFEELQTAMEDDTLFGPIYDIVSVARDSVLTKPSDQVVWAELSYQELLEFRRLSQDSTFNADANAKSMEQWKKRNYAIALKVDSIAQAWKSNRAEWQEANDPNNLISITPVDIDTEYYSYTYGIDEVQIKFKFTPLQGPIEQCQFSYGVFPISSDIHSLLESSDELSDRLGIASLLGNDLLKARCIHSTPITKTQYGWYKVPYSYEDVIGGESVRSLQKGYDLVVDVRSVRMNGKTIDGDGFEMPDAIENYLRFRDFSDSSKYEIKLQEGYAPLYTDDVALEFLDLKYVNQYELFFDYTDSLLTQKFELASKFYDMMYSHASGQ